MSNTPRESYTPHEWESLEIIDHDYLNNMEQGISNLDAEVDEVEENVAEIAGDVTDLKSQTAHIATPEETEADFYVCDSDGNVIAKFVDGHIVTKNFDSASIQLNLIMEADSDEADLYISDSFGNVVAEFKNGHIVTKSFDSADLPSELLSLSGQIAENTNKINEIKRVRTRMEFGAHNGAEYYAPECTVPAYRIAGQQGWEWAWVAGIDFSTDGTMYVIHDDTVDRTTDGTGYLNQMSDQEINALNIDQTGAGYDLSDFDPSELKIPTFEQVLQQCVRYGMKMVLRVSLFPNEYTSENAKARWDYFANLLKGYNVKPDDLSFYLDTGTKANICRNLFGETVEISTHISASATAQNYIDFFDNRSITGNRAAIINYSQIDLAAVKLLHTNGIRVYAYGSNSEAYASNCASLGVDIYQNGKIYKLTD